MVVVGGGGDLEALKISNYKNFGHLITYDKILLVLNHSFFYPHYTCILGRKSLNFRPKNC